MRNRILNNGIEIPTVGLGIFNVKEAEELENAVEFALDAGYRSFDTAQMYENEQLIGQALKKLEVNRKDIFLTTKINFTNMGYYNALDSFEESLKKLQTDYVDMLMIHWPGQEKERLQKSWQALEKIYQDGKARVIGVCNCEIKHLKWIFEICKIKPAINQVERNPRMNDEELKKWCVEHDITMEAWSPLSRGNLNEPEIIAISKKYGKTPAQVVLRWDLQCGYIVIPKSVHKERLEENIDIFNFSLAEDDIYTLSNMNMWKRMSHDPITFNY